MESQPSAFRSLYLRNGPQAPLAHGSAPGPKRASLRLKEGVAHLAIGVEWGGDIQLAAGAWRLPMTARELVSHQGKHCILLIANGVAGRIYEGTVGRQPSSNGVDAHHRRLFRHRLKGSGRRDEGDGLACKGKRVLAQLGL